MYFQLLAIISLHWCYSCGMYPFVNRKHTGFLAYLVIFAAMLC